MTAGERESAERACERLVHLFVHAVDHRQYDVLRQVLAPDTVFDRLGQRIEGLEGILAYMASRPPELYVRHVCTNILIDVEAEDAASGSAYFTFYRHQGPAPDPRAGAPCAGPALMGEYHDSFRRTSEGWRIAFRAVELCFKEERK